MFVVTSRRTGSSLVSTGPALVKEKVAVTRTPMIRLLVDSPTSSAARLKVVIGPDALDVKVPEKLLIIRDAEVIPAFGRTSSNDGGGGHFTPTYMPRLGGTLSKDAPVPRMTFEKAGELGGIMFPDVDVEPSTLKLARLVAAIELKNNCLGPVTGPNVKLSYLRRI
jgi:hypothetical protein